MLPELSVSSSGLDFSNSNVSFHLCNTCSIDLANMAKNNNNKKSALVPLTGR